LVGWWVGWVVGEKFVELLEINSEWSVETENSQKRNLCIKSLAALPILGTPGVAASY